MTRPITLRWDTILRLDRPLASGWYALPPDHDPGRASDVTTDVLPGNCPCPACTDPDLATPTPEKDPLHD